VAGIRFQNNSYRYFAKLLRKAGLWQVFDFKIIHTVISQNSCARRDCGRYSTLKCIPLFRKTPAQGGPMAGIRLQNNSYRYFAKPLFCFPGKII
jgi:hypothetical protein